MDFRTPHTLGERIDEKHTQIVNGAGYDHCYVLNKTESGELSLAATCIEPNSGRTMEVYTTENGALKVPMEPLSLQEVQSALRPSVFPIRPTSPIFRRQYCYRVMSTSK